MPRSLRTRCFLPSMSSFLVLAVLASAVALSASAYAQTFTTLHAFQGPPDGFDPVQGSLILDAAGNLYGVTSLGGTGICDGGCGTVFMVNAASAESVLYSFGATENDGKYPYGSLVRDGAGNLYGTTFGGGTSGSNACNGYGCGTVFKLTPKGKETVLYNFTGGTDGATPEAGVVRDAAGNLYGTTYLGGAYNWGTVFKIDPSGNETVLHSFNGATGDGGDVMGALTMDAEGNLYGTTQGGGISGCNPTLNIGCGTVYEIAKDGTESVLFAFPYPSVDGQWMGEETLLRDKDGNLYGTAQGSTANRGTIFKLDTEGNLTVLHTFTGGRAGDNPWAGVIRDNEGNFYGTTPNGGGTECPSGGCGVVYELGVEGNFRLLHEFTGSPDGAVPFAGLVRDSAGNLYGMTLDGGIGDGVVFKITPQ
jgi:uncharacterized repeat protein (TIGR03803 family)